MTDRHPISIVKQLVEAGQWSECGSSDYSYFGAGGVRRRLFEGNPNEKTMSFWKSHGDHKASGRATLWSAAERYGMR